MKFLAACAFACIATVQAQIGWETYLLLQSIKHPHSHHGAPADPGLFGSALGIMPFLLGHEEGEEEGLGHLLHEIHSWNIVDAMRHDGFGGGLFGGNGLVLAAITGGHETLELLHNIHVFDEVLNHNGAAHHLFPAALLQSGGDLGGEEFIEGMHNIHLLSNLDSIHGGHGLGDLLPLAALSGGAGIFDIEEGNLVASFWALDHLRGGSAGNGHGAHAGHGTHGYSHGAPAHMGYGYGHRAPAVYSHGVRAATPYGYGGVRTAAAYSPYGYGVRTAAATPVILG